MPCANPSLQVFQEVIGLVLQRVRARRCGKLFTYLEETDDPRWPGHKLVENTYIIFTSDNGGMEGSRTQIITDNYPLDRGKISLMEGGTLAPGSGTDPAASSDPYCAGAAALI